jgi:hypothetical protein
MEVSTRTSKSCDKKVSVTSGADSIDIDLTSGMCLAHLKEA